MADNFILGDGGKIIKMEVDYSDAVTQKIPICEKLSKVCYILSFRETDKVNIFLIL